MNVADKGRTYERKMAKALSGWCEFELIRTPMSGAWQGTSGDIKPKDSSQHFPFVVECKNSKDWTMEQLMSSRNKVLQDWLDQTASEIIKDAESGRIVTSFMLIFTRNYKPDYIAIPLQIVPAGLLTQPLNYMIIKNCNPYVLVMELDEFIQHTSYHDLLRSI